MTAFKLLIEIGTWLQAWMTWAAVIYLMAKRLGYDLLDVRSVILEVKPLYLPTAFLSSWGTLNDESLAVWQKAWALLGVFVAWYLINQLGDDDRWKRRRKKLAEKVSVVAGRLAITPA